MQTYVNPHPQRPMVPQQQYQQPVQPQQQQMEQQLLAWMNQSGFQPIQGQNGRMFFQSYVNGQTVPYEAAVQNFMASMNQQPRQMGYLPQQQPMGFPQQPQQPQQPIQGRYMTSPQSGGGYPTGSVQSANQRPNTPSQSGGGFPTEIGGRFGGPSVQQNEVKVTQMSTQPTTVAQTEVAPRKRMLDRISVTSTKLDTLTSRHVSVMSKDDESDVLFAGASVRGIFAGELNILFKQPYKPLYRFDGLVTQEFIVRPTEDYNKLLELFTVSDPKALYRGFRKLLDTKVSSEAKAALIGLDRNLASLVNDFLTIATKGGTQIGSFFEDFNGLLKLLRDNTETLEDDLIEFVTETLDRRMTEPQEGKSSLTITDRVELLRVGILSEEMNLNPDGTPSAAFAEKLLMISEGLTSNVTYLQTLDNQIYKLYDLSIFSEKEFILKPFTE